MNSVVGRAFACMLAASIGPSTLYAVVNFNLANFDWMAEAFRLFFYFPVLLVWCLLLGKGWITCIGLVIFSVYFVRSEMSTWWLLVPWGLSALCMNV